MLVTDTLHLAARLGFTGTSHGVQRPAAVALRRLFLELEPGVVHHGDCIHADALAFRFARDARALTHCHPPDNPRKRAWTTPNDFMEPELPYIVRNHNIVDRTLMMVAVPAFFEEELRSGTWATIRYARKLERPLLLVMPDGSIVAERWPG
jgi:hypothetical protein